MSYTAGPPGLPGTPSARQVTVGGTAALAIDPSSGSAAGPTFKTAAQFAAAIGAFTSNEVNVAMTLTIRGSLSAADPLVLPRIGASGTLVCTGSAGATTIRTSAGGFTAVAARTTAAGGEGQTLTDSALSGNWDVAGPGGTSLLGKRIRITSGARSGGITWGMASLGSKKARCTTPIMGGFALPFSVVPTLITPATSDPYVVESLPTIWLGDGGYVSNSLGAGADTFFRTVIEGVQLEGTTTSPLGIPRIQRRGLNGVIFVGCDLGALEGFYQAQGCLVDNFYMFRDDFILLQACGGQSSFDGDLSINGTLIVGSGTLFQGTSLSLSRGGYIEWQDGSIFGSGNYGIAVASGSAMSVAGPLYGTGQADRAVKVATPGATLALGATPTITGAVTALGDMTLGGVAHTWAAVAAAAITLNGSTVGPIVA